MEKLKGNIKTKYHTEVQRVEGLDQSPQFMIDNEVYYVHSMKESFVTEGARGTHHTLEAVVVKPSIVDTPIWYNLQMDFSSNEWELTETSDPEEEK